MDKIQQLEFSTDLWMRKSARRSPTGCDPLKLDELIMLFSKQLTIQDASVPRRTGKYSRRSVDSSRHSAPPWFTATTTFAPTAPYFALVRMPVKPALASTKIASPSRNLTALCFSDAIVHDKNDSTTPLRQSYCRSRQRASSSSSSGSADESSCSELITPPSSPPASVFLPKTLPDWTTILESVAA